VKVVRPYRVINRENLELGPWIDMMGNAIQDRINFQVGVDPVLKCEVTLHLESIWVDLFDLESNAKEFPSLEWVVEWYCKKTKLGGVAFRADVSNAAQVLELKLPGDLIGGEVEMVRQVILKDDFASTFPLAPKKLGSILWADEFEFRVEGTGGQVPVTFISFEANHLKNSAIWTIDFSKPEELSEESFHEPFAEHFRVLLNDQSQVAHQMSVATNMEQEHYGLIHRTLAKDFLSSLIEQATSESFSMAAAYENGSLGGQIQTTLKLAGISNIEEFLIRPKMVQLAMVQGVAFK